MDFHRLLMLLAIFPAAVSFAQGIITDLHAYSDTLEKFRNGKNIKMLYSESSPLKPEQMKNFKGLKYFPPDPAFVIEAHLTKEEEPETVILRTTTERAPEYLRYGILTFEFQGIEYNLVAFQNKKLLDVKTDETTLFVPFRDGTNGEDTYNGGRYVDCLIPETGNRLIIDFNKAYNPYCAYNPRYSCVIPPEENHLDIRVEAGEKIFEKH